MKRSFDLYAQGQLPLPTDDQTSSLPSRGYYNPELVNTISSPSTHHDPEQTFHRRNLRCEALNSIAQSHRLSPSPVENIGGPAYMADELFDWTAYPLSVDVHSQPTASDDDYLEFEIQSDMGNVWRGDQPRSIPTADERPMTPPSTSFVMPPSDGLPDMTFLTSPSESLLDTPSASSPEAIPGITDLNAYLPSDDFLPFTSWQDTPAQEPAHLGFDPCLDIMIPELPDLQYSQDISKVHTSGHWTQEPSAIQSLAGLGDRLQEQARIQARIAGNELP